MNRKKPIPLLLFLLLLLLIVCVWCHSSNIVKSRAISALPKQDIDFNFVKKANILELKGHFSSDKSIQTLHTATGNTKFNNLSSINEALLAKEGVVSLTQKLLLVFNEHYQEGSISYVNGTLTVEGVVEDEVHKSAITTLLTNSSIDSKNNTRVVIPGPTAEELATIKAKEEADAKEKARLATLAEHEAKEKARLKAEQEAKAKREAQEKAKVFEAKIKKILSFENISFELNKATLTEKSIDTVSHIAQILKENPNVHVEIGGHSDDLGDDAYNLSLSQKRVDAVKEKLVQMEIEAERITAVGYGENRPLVSNDTEENRRTNRRVEFKVLGE